VTKQTPVQHDALVNGVRLTYFERNPTARGAHPTLLFAHANGYHARIWDHIIARLPSYHSIAVDQRGHGRSEKRRITHWRQLIEDIAALVEALHLERIVAIGHSMGGHAIIGAAALCPHRFARLIAIDPVIGPRESYEGESSAPLPEGGVHPASRRHNHFTSAESMAARLLGKGSFAKFDAQMLHDYCEHGLLPDPSGDGFVLACPPEIEASVYMTSRSNGAIYDAIRAIDIPTLILRAHEPEPSRGAMNFAASPTAPGLVQEFKHGREIYYPHLTHFIPMEIPDEVARLIAEEVDAASAQSRT